MEGGKIYSSRMALATGGSGNTYNEARTAAHNTTVASIKYTLPSKVISTPASPTFTNPTIDNSTMSVLISSKTTSNETTLINSTPSALISDDSTSRNQALDGLFWSNSTLNNTENKYVNEHTKPILAVSNGPIANSRHHWLHRPVSIQNETRQCSGIMTVVPEIVTIIFTSLEVIYELTTVYGNATFPTPEIVSPVTACSTYSSHLDGPQHRPGVVPSISSVLLVTKKIPVVVRSPQTVGPIYNLPTTTAQPIQVQSAADFGQAGHSSAPKIQALGGEDRSAGSAPLQQAFAQADSLAAWNANAIGEQAPGKDRQTAKIGGQKPGGGQTSSDGGQTGHDLSGNQNPKGEGQRPSGETTPGAGDQSASTDSKSSSGSSQLSSGQTVSGPSSSSGAEANSQNVGSGATSLTGSGAQSSAGDSVVVGGSSSNPDQTSRGNPVDAGSNAGQYAAKAVNVNNIPISIDSAAVIVGSQTINAGSPPTTVVANGQTITIDQSQIVAPGTTIPIEATVATSPASSVTIDGVPVVLQPSNVVIGSQTFSHGSSAAFAIYNDQTYSWDAKQLVGPGGIMAVFPSATTVAPRITAGGQVFSVLSSTLKAIGTDIAIPNTPSASPFVYQNQIFSVNPSKLVAADMRITVPPATTQPTAFVHNGQTFSIDNSQFIAPSATIPLPSGSGTVRYGTTVLTVDQTHIVCADTTITLSSVPQPGSPATPSAVTTGGLAFSLGPAAAVIASSTYSFLPGQTPATVTDQGLTVTLVSSGVHFGSINVPVPTSPPNYSVVTQGNLTFSVAPSAVVFNGQTNSVQAGMAPRITTVNGQELSIGPQGVGLAGTIFPLPKVTDPSGYAVVTQGDLTLSVAPSAVVLNGHTNNIQSGMAPIMTNVNGQSVSIGPQGVGLASTTIPLPMATNSAGYAMVTHGALTFSVAPSAVVLHGQTNSVQSGMVPITTTVDGQTVSIGPQGVGIANTTISLPSPPPAYAVVTRGDLTFSVAPTEAVFKGSTFSIGANMTATIVVNGQIVGVGPSQIDFRGTTVDLPSTTRNEGPAAVTVDGLTVDVGPTEAVVGGSTYAIGSGAMPKTIVVGSKTIGLGANGVVLPSTTVPPEHTPTAVTADGFTFLADATEAIINGTAYAIGSEAIAKTILYGSETIGLGTKGIVLPSTTIVPWGNATQTSLYSMYSASAAAASSRMSSISAAADGANMLPTGLPGISPGGTKSNIHRGTGHAPRPPTFLIFGTTVGGLMLGLLACL